MPTVSFFPIVSFQKHGEGVTAFQDISSCLNHLLQHQQKQLVERIEWIGLFAASLARWYSRILVSKASLKLVLFFSSFLISTKAPSKTQSFFQCFIYKSVKKVGWTCKSFVYSQSPSYCANRYMIVKLFFAFLLPAFQSSSVFSFEIFPRLPPSAVELLNCLKVFWVVLNCSWLVAF